MDIKTQIDGISLIDIINKLGLKYSKGGTGGEYQIHENGKPTDGWRFNDTKGLVTDFSGKGRAIGDKIGFVSKFLNKDFKETLEWFKQVFGLIDISEKQINEIKDKWNNLSNLTDKQIEYVKSRGIDYEKVKLLIKNFNGGIGHLISNYEKVIGLSARLIEGDIRFTSMPGYSTNGVYCTKLDDSNKDLIVVEGMFDYLTIRQFYKNTVGLQSATSGIDTIREYAKNYNIILIYDNDEAGKKLFETLKKEINLRYLDLSEYGYKDINEFEVKEKKGEDLINFIFTNSKTEDKGDISNAFKQMEFYNDIIKQTGKLGFDGPFSEIDKVTEGIIPGKVYAIGGPSNMGKSKLSYHYCNYFIGQGKRVNFYSLEVDKGMLLMNLICNKYQVGFNEVKKGEVLVRKEFFKTLKIYDDIFKLEDIVESISKDLPDIVFIDFVQNILCKGQGSYEVTATVAKKIQETAIKTKSVIFSLSQLSNDSIKENNKDNQSMVNLKGGGELIASSDVVLLINRKRDDFMNTDKMNIYIKKNKYGPAGITFQCDINLNKGQFTNLKQI